MSLMLLKPDLHFLIPKSTFEAAIDRRHPWQKSQSLNMLVLLQSQNNGFIPFSILSVQIRNVRAFRVPFSEVLPIQIDIEPMANRIAQKKPAKAAKMPVLTG